MCQNKSIKQQLQYDRVIARYCLLPILTMPFNRLRLHLPVMNPLAFLYLVNKDFAGLNDGIKCSGISYGFVFLDMSSNFLAFFYDQTLPKALLTYTFSP